jgi:hypothetical protein
MLAALGLFPGLLLAADDAGSGEAAPKFDISTKRKDDQVEARADKGKVVFVVKSPFGISQAVIKRVADDWPKAVTVRLHLKGLSSFRAANGKVTLDAAVRNENGRLVSRLWKDGKEDAPLDDKSPFWAAVRAVGGDGQPARELPLKDGYFEVTLPRAFFEGNPASVTLSWIDFYRS